MLFQYDIAVPLHLFQDIPIDSGRENDGHFEDLQRLEDSGDDEPGCESNPALHNSFFRIRGLGQTWHFWFY